MRNRGLNIFNNQPFHFVIEFNRFQQNGWTLYYGYKIDNLEENKFEVIINPTKSKFDGKDKSFKTIHFSTIDKLFKTDVYLKNRSIAPNFKKPARGLTRQGTVLWQVFIVLS